MKKATTLRFYQNNDDIINSVDFQESKFNNIELPLPHLKIRLVRANETYFLAGRGTFKTSRGISLYYIDCVYEMPRSTGVIVSPSFEVADDNTLNPLMKALDEFGFEQGVHYVKGIAPPKEWEQPYIKINSKKYDHIISWHNGSNQFIISLARIVSAHGISAQWGIFDEAKFMNQKVLQDEIFPIFRGNEKYFAQSSLFMSKFFATDKLADPASIQWLLNKRSLNDENKINIIISLQLELDRLKAGYNTVGINAKQKLKVQINAIELRLFKLRKNLTYYAEANHLDVIPILGQAWYDDKVKNLKPYELSISIHNEDPVRPEDGFYPDFTKTKHCYQLQPGQSDYEPGKPLIIAADYQHSVSPICICQIGKLPGANKESLNFIDEVATVSPEGLDAALTIFIERYKNHPNKRVIYVYDQTATGRQNDRKEFYKTVIDKLKSASWRVTEVYIGKQPNHFDKYTDTKAWLRNETGDNMDIQINELRCPFLIKSIEGAPVKIENKETKKDKRFEDTIKYPTLDQRTTTHFSDVFDMITDAVIKKKKVINTQIISTGIGFGNR